MHPSMMIDCTPLNAGGGVQVAIALLDSLSRTDRRWTAAIPTTMIAQLPHHLAFHPNVVVFPKRWKVDLARLHIQLLRLEATFHPDVVFTVFGPAYFKAKAPHLVGFALPNLVYPPEILWPKPSIWFKLSNQVKAGMLKHAEQIVVETDTFRRRTVEALGFDPARVHVIGNAVNPILERYPPSPLVRPLEGGGRTRILIPSAWYPHKNLESVIDVAVHFRRAYPQLEICFQFTLAPQSGGWLRLQEAAKKAGVEGYVTTLGALTLDQLATAYHNAQMVYLPTLREASTAVYPEAFHFSRPLVTTDIDFARELCGEAALFVNPDHAAETATAIAALLTNPSLQQALISSGNRQLKCGYPSAEEKFKAQLDLMLQVSKSRTRLPQ